MSYVPLHFNLLNHKETTMRKSMLYLIASMVSLCFSAAAWAMPMPPVDHSYNQFAKATPIVLVVKSDQVLANLTATTEMSLSKTSMSGDAGFSNHYKSSSQMPLAIGYTPPRALVPPTAQAAVALNHNTLTSSSNIGTAASLQSHMLGQVKRE